MATNPITSDSLTLDFTQLMRIPIGTRVQAASMSGSFLQSLINALTPIQIAKAFPDYYRRSLPDISNFILTNRYFDAGGQAHQTGGGELGYTPDYYDGENKPSGVPRGSELTVEQMKQKLLENGINVDNTYDLLSQGPVLAGDERLQFIKNLSTDKLLEMGIEKYQSEEGKDLFRLRPVSAEGMTDEQIQVEMKKEAASKEGTYRPAYPLSDIDLSPEVINTIAGEALNNKESIDGVINNMLNRVGVQKDWNNLKDVARAPGQYAGYRVASEEQAEIIKARIKEITSGKVPSNIGAATEFRAEYYVKGEGYGKTFEREARKQGYLQPGPGDNVYAETFAAGPYAPRKAEEVEKIKLENAAKINKSYTPEEIKIYREELIRKQVEELKGKAVKNLYDLPSPTSSYSPVYKEGETVVSEKQQDVARVRRQPITPELKEVLQYAGEETGVVVEVFSGGQNDITQGGDRTGSERHDLGHAADVKLKVRDADGKMRVLDARNPEDRAIMSKFVETSRMMGAKGIGSGLGYMGESAIHIGTVQRPDLDYSDKEYGAPAGKEAVWQSDKWVQEAFSRGQQSAVDFEKSGGMAEYRKRREEKIAEQQKRESDKTAAAKKQEVVQVSPNETIPYDNPAVKEQVAAASINPTPQFALGGNMYGLNEDMTLVETETGKPIAQIGQNEKIEKQGNAIQVTPETKLKADELAEKYDASADVETRMNDMEDRIDQQQESTSQINRKTIAPDRVDTSPPDNWREAIKEAERPVSPSFHRAIARTKFFPEGYHFNRSSPGSISK